MNKMENEFLKYEEALALKELRFDEPCLKYWNGIGEYFDQKNWFNWNQSENFVSIPLYQQAFRWFREKYDLCGIVLPFGEGLFDYRIYSAKEGKHLFGSPEFKTYEEADLACLIKLIEIVKNK